MRYLLVAAMVATLALIPAEANAQAPACREVYIGSPINERGVSCPGNPIVWKSFTFDTAGFGYYTLTEQRPDGSYTIQIYYQHRDGPLAYRVYRCWDRLGATCRTVFWNGVPFP